MARAIINVIGTVAIAAVGAALMIGMVFGAALQEQDKLSEMAAEVTE